VIIEHLDEVILLVEPDLEDFWLFEAGIVLVGAKPEHEITFPFKISYLSFAIQVILIIL
jgi:hypothetical protein